MAINGVSQTAIQPSTTGSGKTSSTLGTPETSSAGRQSPAMDKSDVYNAGASSGAGKPAAEKGPVDFARGQFLQDISQTAGNMMSSKMSAREKFDGLNEFSQHIANSKLSPFMKKQALHQIAGQAAAGMPNPKDRMDFQQKFFDANASDGIKNARQNSENWEFTGYSKKEAASAVYDSYRKEAGFD